MSDTVRIGLVSEGITDFVFINSAIESMMADRPFILRLLQPEESVAFTGGGSAGSLGGGWRGVHKWCQQSALRTRGTLIEDPLFIGHDLLILHLDADVAAEDLAGDLPCEQPCPPPSATTDHLRVVMLSWLGETAMPERTVLCTPSKSTEAWVVACCFPNDTGVSKTTWECFPNPAVRLAQQPRPQRFTKSRADYEQRHATFVQRWPAIATTMSEAARFHSDFTAAVNRHATP